MRLLRAIFVVIIVCCAFAWPVDGASVMRFALIHKSDREVQVFVRNARDLSAFEIELRSEEMPSAKSARFRLRNVARSSLLEKSPRSFSQVGPHFSPDGALTFGFFSFGADPGIQGNGALARITFKGGASGLRITHVKATDSKGNQVACRF